MSEQQPDAPNPSEDQTASPLSSEPQDPLIELLDKCASGDRAAFKDLYDASAPKLYGIVSRILGQNSDADEVLQDVYLRLWQNAGRFDPRAGQPITWMATIARNRAIDVARQRKPEAATLPPRSLAEEAETLGAIKQISDASPEKSDLHTCLGKLDETNQQSVILAYCYGYSRGELAARFDHPSGQVKLWLRRTLRQLQECLSG